MITVTNRFLAKLISLAPEQSKPYLDAKKYHPNGNIKCGETNIPLTVKLGEHELPIRPGSTLCYTPKGKLTPQYKNMFSIFILSAPKEVLIGRRHITLAPGDAVVLDRHKKIEILLFRNGNRLMMRDRLFSFFELGLAPDGTISYGLTADTSAVRLGENIVIFEPESTIYFDDKENILWERTPLSSNTLIKFREHYAMAQKGSTLSVLNGRYVRAFRIMEHTGAEFTIKGESVAFTHQLPSERYDLFLRNNGTVAAGRLRDGSWLYIGKARTLIPKLSIVGFYPDGRLMSVILSEHTLINGRPREKGTVLLFDRAGKELPPSLGM